MVSCVSFAGSHFPHPQVEIANECDLLLVGRERERSLGRVIRLRLFRLAFRESYRSANAGAAEIASKLTRLRADEQFRSMLGGHARERQDL